MKKSNRLTIRDIAKLAGISPTTVSFYLNGKADKFNLARKTCQKIQNTIDNYNYHPNFHARAINESQTYLVGLLLHNIISSFHNRLVWGIEHELSKQGFHLVLSETENNLNSELAAIRFMAQTGVDGYIMVPAYDCEKILEAYDNEVFQDKPVVNVLFGAPSVPTLDTNHTQGGRLVAEAFWQAGHRRVAYFGEALHPTLGHFSNERFEAFRDYYRENGLEIEVFSDINQLLARIDNVTAVFCFRDLFAVNLMFALQDHGLSVPGDISLAGYGAEDGVEQFVRPPLTTVREHKEELGILAARQLLAKINDHTVEIPPRTRLHPVFIPGSTLQPPRKNM